MKFNTEIGCQARSVDKASRKIGIDCYQQEPERS